MIFDTAMEFHLTIHPVTLNFPPAVSFLTISLFWRTFEEMYANLPHYDFFFNYEKRQRKVNLIFSFFREFYRLFILI